MIGVPLAGAIALFVDLQIAFNGGCPFSHGCILACVCSLPWPSRRISRTGRQCIRFFLTPFPSYSNPPSPQRRHSLKSPLHDQTCVQTSKKSLPGKLNLPSCFPSFVSPLRNTNRTALAKLNFIFLRWEGTGAMMWEMYAG